METSEKKTDKEKDTGKKEENQQKEQGFDFSDIDFNKILSNPSLTELIKHLLTAAGAMGANYLIWVKPMQDKMEAMNQQINKQESLIKDLQATLDKVKKELEEFNTNAKSGMNEELFSYKTNSTHSGNHRNYRHVHL